MGKLTAIQTYDRFSKLWAQNKINDRSLNFILDTGQLYTHGIFLNSVAYGTEANGAIQLIVAGTTKTLSLSSHTHSIYLEKNANINLGSYKIVSGQKDLLYYSGGNTYLGDTTTPAIILGTSLSTVRNNTTYTILDTGNFSIGNTTAAGYTLQNVAVFKYGSSTYQLDYVKRINTSSTFDTLATYTNAGTTLVNGKQHGILTFYTDGTINNPSWAQIRVNIPDKLVEFRTSAASANWITLNPPTINNNAKNVAGIVAAPPANTNYNVWMTDNAQNPAWRSASVNNPTLAWGEEATVGTLGALTFKVTMPSNPNTDYTGIKLGTVTGTKKTDSTLLKALSSTGLIVQGGTNLFKIGDGTNYIEVSVKHGLSTKNISINGTNYAVYTSESSLPTIITPTSLGSAGQVLTVNSNANGLSWTTLTNTNVTTSAVVASQSTGTTQIQADQTDPFYNLIEGSTITRSIQFKAGTGLTIKSNANGVITFTNSSPASGLSTKNININGTNYAVYTSANSLPSFVAPTSLAGTGGQILATNSNKTGFEWVAKPVNSWRNIRINDDDSDLLNTGTNSGALYIKQGTGITVSWTNSKLIITNASPNVWKAANTSQEGYVPKLATGGGTIASTDSVYVLAYKSGVSGTTTPTWLQLPANAYKNDNTWRGIQDNLTSSTNTTESLSAKQGYLLANGYARDSSKQFAYKYGTTGSTTKIKISINTTIRYMLSFVVTLYQGYRSTKIMVSGYNYASNYWLNPRAVILGDTNSSTVNVYFGYDGLDQLWVGLDGGSYTGVCITDVCNGYNQITSQENLFTISNVSEFGGTTQHTVTPVNPYLNTWIAWSGATANTNGTAGYMPAPTSAQRGQFLRGDGSWVSLNNYSLSVATTSALGGIIISNTLSTAVTLTSGNGNTANRYYGVQVDKDGKAFVNIPWTNTWKQNTSTQEGYVPAPGANVSGKVWMTGSDGTPSWQNANNHSHSYLPLTGGTISGSLKICKYLYFEAFPDENNRYGTGTCSIYFNQASDLIRFDGVGNISLKGTLVSLNGHKHPYTDITGSGTTADMALVSTTTANTLAFKQLGSNAFNSTAYLPLAGGTMTADSAISWGNNDRTDWNTYVTGLKIISSTTANSGAPTTYSTALSVIGRYGFQIAAQGGNVNTFYIRNNNNGIWRVLIHSDNYTSYRHAYTNLTGSGTTADQAIVSTGTANGWTLKTLGSNAFSSTSYLPLSGGTLTGDLEFNDMNNGINWNVNYLGGWARSFIQFYQHSDSDSSKSLESVFSIGAQGDASGYVYSWIGTSNYAGANLRFYKNGSITIGANPIYHAGNLKTMVKSGSTHAGGLVPDPGATEGTTKFLCEDGTWKIPAYTSDTNTWREIKVNGTQKRSTNITSGDLDFINGSNTTVEWTSENKLKINSTWTAWKGATSSANGTAGYMPAPTSAQRNKFLRGDGTWQELNNFTLPSRLNEYITSNDLSEATYNGFGRINSGSPLAGFAGSAQDCMTINTAYSALWAGQLALDYRTSNIAYRAKNNGTWQSWAIMLTTLNWTTYAQTSLVLGASTAVANATSDTANNATYLNTIQNSAKSGGIQIIGSGSTTVKANGGVLTINSTVVNNNTYAIKSKIGDAVTTISDFTANQNSNDDFTLIQGTNVTFTNNATNRTLTIASKDTWIAWAGASSTNGGTAGYMPAAGTANYNKFLRGDGQWCTLATPDATYSFTVTKGITANTWTDTGLSNSTTGLTTSGTYVVQIKYSNDIYSGIMSWYAGTGGVAEEVVLHYAGNRNPDTARIYMKTEGGKIYITANGGVSTLTYTINIRKLI